MPGVIFFVGECCDPPRMESHLCGFIYFILLFEFVLGATIQSIYLMSIELNLDSRGQHRNVLPFFLLDWVIAADRKLTVILIRAASQLPILESDNNNVSFCAYFSCYSGSYYLYARLSHLGPATENWGLVRDWQRH